MKLPRLVWLVGVMLALALVRLLFPPGGGAPPPALAEPVTRQRPAQAAARADAPRVAAGTYAPRQLDDEPEPPANAFDVRRAAGQGGPRLAGLAQAGVPVVQVAPPSPQPAPLPVPSPQPLPAPAPVAPAAFPALASVPPEPVAPPSPYQVIGTWDDAADPGVFLSSPTGTVLARAGATLQAQYKVLSISAHQVVIQHIASQRELRLVVNRPPGTLPHPQ